MKSKASDLALSALVEVADPGSVGALISEQKTDDQITDFHFECGMRGYLGWHWVVTTAQVNKKTEPTVAEISLMAGPDAVLAPPWVPWAERLSEFRRQLREEGKAATDAEADALIRGMAGSSFSDDEESEESERNTNHGSVQPPLKTRVRQRRIKRQEPEDYEGPEPDSD